MKRLYKQGFRAAAACTAFAMLAACSSSGGSSGGTNTTSNDASAAHGVQEAQTLLDQFSGPPSFVAPGPSFDAKKAAGKTIFTVPVSTSVAAITTVDDTMARDARALGVRYVSYPNQQQQSQWVAGLNQATSTHADAINLLEGIPPELVNPQLAAAVHAGIPTVDSNERTASQPTNPNVKGYVFGPYQQGGKLMGAWAVARTHGNADILLLTSNADISSAPIEDGVRSEVSATCSACKITVQNVNPVDWATELQSTVSGALAGDPHINYILAVFDGMAQFAAPAVVASGRSGSVHIAAYGGTPAILDLMRTGKIVNMIVGANTSEIAADTIDQDLRLMLGMAPGNEHIGLRVFTADNVADAGIPAQPGAGYGDAFRTGFAKVWGVDPTSIG